MTSQLHAAIYVGMYVRRITRRRSDGTQVGYLQLAHKVRHPETGRPQDKVLHHFGPEDQLDADQIRRLIKSLSRFLPQADRAATQVALELDEDVEVQRVQKLGGTWVLDGLWKMLGLDDVLAELADDRAFRRDVERLLFAMVANRALAPASKLGVERWVEQVHVPGLDTVAVQQLYRAMDFLVEHGEAIQKAVFFATSSLLNLDVDLLFFDTTSTYFEIEDDDGDAGMRRYGNSKDHRPDRAQVVIGLAVTLDGLPVRCWTLPGNTADASLVEQVQADLAGWRLNRVVWVMDRGFNGEQQKLALQRGGGHYIIGEKLRAGMKHNDAALSRPGRLQTVRDNLEVKDVRVTEGSRTRRYVVVRNPRQAERDRELRASTLERLQAEIDLLNARRSRDRGTHSKAVCNLKTHRSMGRYVRELKSGELRIDRARVREDEKLDGKYLLSTSDLSLSAEDVALGYKQLLEVEAAFRTLKSTLDLRPIYHRLPRRIDAHVLLNWLALLLVRLVERQTGATWPRVRDALEPLSLVSVRTSSGDFQVVSNLTSEQRTVLQSLGLSAPKRLQKVDLAG